MTIFLEEEKFSGILETANSFSIKLEKFMKDAEIA